MGDINVRYVCDCTGFYLSLNYICTFVSSPQRNIILERKQTFMYTVHTHTDGRHAYKAIKSWFDIATWYQ